MYTSYEEPLFLITCKFCVVASNAYLFLVSLQYGCTLVLQVTFEPVRQKKFRLGTDWDGALQGMNPYLGLQNAFTSFAAKE